MAELKAIDSAYSLSKQAGKSSRLMVGFNRRFAPLMVTLKGAVKQQQPMSIVYTCNAGAIPSESWVHDLERGGGRIIGEACHFIDICRFLTGSSILSIHSSAMGGDGEAAKNTDTVTLTIKFENGSIGTVHYFANGHRSFPKERIEVFQSGGVAVLDNFSKLKSYGFNGLKSKSLFRQDKGITDCAKAFVESIEAGSECPIPFAQLMEVSKFSIIAASQLLSIKAS
jgi:predicted dehydrogenase